ncbi:DNA replication/repair protein RecF [Cryobacterium sp. CG_9.6]|uniref:DNA replication/repair protein RecF n=1 Tax=Cryobacterium sp. CG_9.6 TaxID=2760710 RepID=UPI0024764D4B|nr:DNA replication/repair protein RecF [Cryobacterium sp. CG_9.6]MDH6235447.1 DNA replication and repair protein RecF [Cryobacterium sp. CG_9.6]
MRVTHLSLTDFRNYTEAEVPLRAGANLIVGRNGQGKTNLVEALGYLSTLGSHRVSDDKAMIRAGQPSAIIRARLEYNGREILTEVQLNRVGLNRAQVNRSAIRTRDLPRYFSSVVFAPEDLALVRGDPSGRRRFLDQLLVLRSPRMSGVIADYERVLKQRNSLLKSARGSMAKQNQLSTLDIWDERLIGLGSEIIDARSELVWLLGEPLRAAYRAVVGDDHGPQLVELLSVFGADGDAGVSARGVPGGRGVSTSSTSEMGASQGIEARETTVGAGAVSDDAVRGVSSGEGGSSSGAAATADGDAGVSARGVSGGRGVSTSSTSEMGASQGVGARETTAGAGVVSDDAARGVSSGEGGSSSGAAATGDGEAGWSGRDGTREAFREALAGVRGKELERGITLVGPHRDDLIFILNDLPAKGYASHGESWSFALSLKLASAELLRRDSATGDPVLILDDVFAELDQSRRRRLAEAISEYEQVLITAAVLDDVPEAFTAHTIHIRGGAVVDA